VNQEEARESKQEEEARESHHKLPGVLESVREYEGMNPHTPKATPTLGDGVPFGAISGLPLGSPGREKPFGCSLRGQPQSIL